MPLENQRAIAAFLERLQTTGATQQAITLIDRLPGAGMFELFCKLLGRKDEFRFGQETNGTPATRWGWEDLNLWLLPNHSPA